VLGAVLLVLVTLVALDFTDNRDRDSWRPEISDTVGESVLDVMRRRWKIIVVLVALVFVSGYAGALIGARISAQKKRGGRSHPEAWNVSAMNTLERR